GCKGREAWRAEAGTMVQRLPMIPGSYVVSTWVTNASGSDWENKTGYISAGSTQLIVLDSPFDDTTINGSIVVAGTVADPLVANVTIGLNGVNTSIPVTDSNFSAIVNLTTISTLVVSAVD